MKYINISVALLDLPEYGVSSMDQVGTWLFLLRYCHAQENYGKIEDCKRWPERLWIKMGLPSGATVLADSPLWHWQGTTLVVHHYNKEQQERYHRMVRQRKGAIASRWARKKSPGSNGNHAVE